MRTIKNMNLSSLLNLKKPEVASVPLNIFRLNVYQLIAKYSAELGVAPTQLKLKSLRSRWGSCTRKGVITINTKLKNLPVEMLELVVFHECLHLVHMNHGKGFKLAMMKKFPNKKELEHKLKLFGFSELSK